MAVETMVTSIADTSTLTSSAAVEARRPDGSFMRSSARVVRCYHTAPRGAFHVHPGRCRRPARLALTVRAGMPYGETRPGRPLAACLARRPRGPLVACRWCGGCRQTHLA